MEDAAVTESTEGAKAVTPGRPADYQQRLDKFAREINNPEMVKAYAEQFCRSMGLTTEQYEKATGIKAEDFVHQQTMYLANAVNTMLPRLLPPMMRWLVETAYPGFGAMYEAARKQQENPNK